MNEGPSAGPSPKWRINEAVLVIILAVGVCMATGTAFFLYALGKMVFHKSEPTPNPAVHFNPVPKLSFEIAARSIEGAGNFVITSAKARYSIQNNRTCVPAEKNIGRGDFYETFEIDSALSVARQGEGYTLLIAHDDLYQDADFYGLGLCDYAIEWIMTHVTSDPAIRPVRQLSLWISRKNFMEMRFAPITFYCDKQAGERASCVGADSYARMLPHVAEKRQAALTLQAKSLGAYK